MIPIGTDLFHGSEEAPPRPTVFRVQRIYPHLLRPKPESDVTVRTPAPAGFTPTDEAP